MGALRVRWNSLCSFGMGQPRAMPCKEEQDNIDVETERLSAVISIPALNWGGPGFEYQNEDRLY